MDIRVSQTLPASLGAGAAAPLLALNAQLDMLRAQVAVFLPVQYQLPVAVIAQLAFIAEEVAKVSAVHTTLWQRVSGVNPLDQASITDIHQRTAALDKVILGFARTLTMIRAQLKGRVRLAAPYLGEVSTRRH